MVILFQFFNYTALSSPIFLVGVGVVRIPIRSVELFSRDLLISICADLDIVCRKQRSLLDSILSEDAIIIPCKGLLKACAMSLPVSS